ncbi:hypothetical protein Q2V64_27690, partial [Escherichia coli]|nr:hypothetical protein [Escherichia coli]
MPPSLRKAVAAAIGGGAIAIASVLITGPSGDDGLEGCQRQDYWPFFAIFNVRYWSLMLSAFRHFIITDWRGVFCQHSR